MNGTDLIGIGYRPGPAIGHALRKLLDEVVADAGAEHEGAAPEAREGAPTLITWEQPGYVVAFTTRVGGVSEGIYESLNLTARTGDDAARVEENRRRACAPRRAFGTNGSRSTGKCMRRA